MGDREADKVTQEELIKIIARQPSLTKGQGLKLKLFEYLVPRSGTPIDCEEIAKGAFGIDPTDKGVGERIRWRCGELREALDIFNAMTDYPITCSFPDAQEVGGYMLEFKEKKDDRSGFLFWNAHLGKYPPVLVYAEPVFFYDIVTSAYMRFWDVNPRENNHALAIQSLMEKHGKELEKQYEEPLGQRLRATRVYVGLGEVAALDILGAWFSKRAFIYCKKEASDRVSTTEGSPILLGSYRTNRLIDAYLETEESGHFAYSLHKEKFGFVRIKNATETEKQALEAFAPTRDGEFTKAGKVATISQKRDRLFIVQRMLVPGTRRPVTMVSSDTTLGIRQVAIALTENEQVGAIVRRISARDGSVPESFELLFSVRIAPAQMEHETGEAQLIGCRAY